jgi:hypothetical protein
MDISNYKDVVEKLVESVEETKRFRDSAKESIEAIREIEVSISKEIETQKSITENALNSMKNYLSSFSGNVGSASNSLQFNAKSIVDSFDKYILNQIQIINDSADNSINQLRNEISGIIDKSANFHLISSLYIKNATETMEKINSILELHKISATEATTRFIETNDSIAIIGNRSIESFDLLNVVNEKVDKLLKSIGVPISTNEKPINNATPSSNKPSQPVKGPSADRDANEYIEYEAIILKTSYVALLNTLEDLIQGVSEQKIYANLSAFDLSDRNALMRISKELLRTKKGVDFLLYSKPKGSNKQIDYRIERVISLIKSNISSTKRDMK